MLSVGVNLLWCRPGQVGGSEEYLVRQLRGLGVAAPDIIVRLAVPPGFSEAHPGLAERFEVVVGPMAIAKRRSARIIAEARSLPRMLGTVDVVHHAGGTMPPRGSRRSRAEQTVLTIHDAQYLRFPEYFSAARRNYLRWRVPRSARQADIIAVPSAFVRDTVVGSFDVDPANVMVVHHGVDPPADGVIPEAEALRRRYAIGDRRVLVYPAITHPHKGHRFLVELLAGPWSESSIVLLLLGGKGAADEDVELAVAERGLAQRVLRLGRVPDGDRDGLIALAEALVFPSEYEGFGAPALEAMNLGTPVICSDQAALPEVVGDAAIVAPLRVEAWADALDLVASDRQGMIARGHRRAAAFSTVASGRAAAAAYRRAAEVVR